MTNPEKTWEYSKICLFGQLIWSTYKQRCTLKTLKIQAILSAEAGP